LLFQDKMMKKIIVGFGITLIVVGIIILIFFINYKGSRLHLPSFVGVLLGAGLTGLGLKISLNDDYIKTDEEVDETTATFLTQKGQSIAVELSNCEIIEGEEAKAKYKKHCNTEFYDEEVFSKQWAKKHSDVINPVCIQFYLMDAIYVSPLIYMQKHALQQKLSNQKLTTIYIHKKKRRVYYFDLEFLLEN
jgi:hypothetical protein